MSNGNAPVAVRKIRGLIQEPAAPEFGTDTATAQNRHRGNLKEGAASMSISVSLQTEARLTEEAQRQGVSVDALLEWFIISQDVARARVRIAPELPVWHLGPVGPLHRRDIYDDVR